MRALILATSLIFISCGSSKETKDDRGKQISGWSKIKPLLDEYCLGCHASAAFLASGSAFKASKAPTRVENRSMPKVGSAQAQKMTDEERAQILAYVKEKPDASSSKYE